MKNIFTAVAGELKKDASTDEVTELIRKHISRRQFLGGAGTIGLGLASMSLFGCGASGSSATDAAPRQAFVANAQGMVVADSTLCVGCRRCEAACVGYNQGIVQPSIANVKVSRNQQFGVAGVTTGFQRGDGDFGNFRTVQDTCRQCPHPVSCQLACPHDAIEVIAPVNARVVNIAKCVGCGICVAACPWGMTSLNGPVNAKNTKSNKCTLCNGNPECVQACPSGALKYTAWADRTKVIPARQVVPASIASAVQNTCISCH
jgi:Fe-S-cluster-containing hydrogenase component 2